MVVVCARKRRGLLLRLADSKRRVLVAQTDNVLANIHPHSPTRRPAHALCQRRDLRVESKAITNQSINKPILIQMRTAEHLRTRKAAKVG